MDLQRAEAAIGEVEDDPRAMEAVQAVVAMYGAGLARIVDRVGAPALIDDELVSHLLIVHDLHPVPVEERVRRVLTGGVELVSVEDGVVRVRLKGNNRLAVEEAIRSAAPDVDEIVAEDAEPVMVLQVAGQKRLA